ncbi:Defensin-like protein [Forsythia ovata]|uniref:Defensin-like protein n=1 Tax=Forsythia ovata TaxID=205694 RepID=A0ABD1T5J1_9LAMI
MDTKKVSSVRTSLFIGLICMALLFTTVSCEENRWLVIQGPCSQFPDCNGTCIKNGYKSGGKCVEPAKGIAQKDYWASPDGRALWSLNLACPFQVGTHYINNKNSKLSDVGRNLSATQVRFSCGADFH